MGAVRAGRLSLTLMSVIHIAALSVASFACAFDLRTRRIPNWLTFGAAAVGLAYHIVTGGASGAALGIAGWATGVALLIAPYALGGMGAGDLKLLGALGAWLGPGDIFWLAMYTGIAGAVMALIVGAWNGYLRPAVGNIWLLLTHWRVSGLRPFPELTLESSQGPRLAYAAPILVGTIVVLWLR
jgi:prepilin peptidase CpaA